VVPAVLSLHLEMVGREAIGRRSYIWDPRQSLFLVRYQDRDGRNKRGLDCSPAGLWHVLPHVSAPYVVAAERKHAYEQDDVMCIALVYDSGDPTLLEIGNYL